ncbi:cupin domain-containing protein [Halopenitus persicus]|uniref:Cupin domain-containing protein n=1 Tax=Halopenitus persicus TaxID=1048396 RepID=A0A1H3E4A6_9EURY|nr:cupin domain-containing protein [Halopenitus persicus]QHS16488.1 cupin domain-containing protein [haloarchaeon 3A1-DGR]SDX73505.1 Cupin domain-containing protein [Halopenitus persicus]
MATIRSLADLEGAPHANAFPSAEPKTIRLRLEAGERVDPHRHPDREIVAYLLEGAIDLHLDDEIHELEPGDVARFDGDREISPVARADSTALLVLAPRAED